MIDALNIVEDITGNVIVSKQIDKGEGKKDYDVLFDSFEATGGDKIADINLNVVADEFDEFKDTIIIEASSEKYKLNKQWFGAEVYLSSTKESITYLLVANDGCYLIEIYSVDDQQTSSGIQQGL